MLITNHLHAFVTKKKLSQGLWNPVLKDGLKSSLVVRRMKLNTHKRAAINQCNHLEMAAAVRSIATVDRTTLRHVTTLSIPLSAGYRVAIDSNAASVHKGAHPPLLCEQNVRH